MDVVNPSELRRVVVKFTRTPGGGVTEDAAAFTYHLGKLAGGDYVNTWVAADMAQCEVRLDALWTTLKPFYLAGTILAGYVWYRDNHTFSPDDRADGPSNPAVRSTIRNVAGTDASASQLPPQVALSVTKIVSVRKRWGRLFLPATRSGTAGPDGRIAGGNLAPIQAAMVALFNAHRADGYVPVIFSRGRSAHPDKSGAVIPAHTNTAYEITSIQMDNVFDVIRSRRWAHPTTRTVTVLT